MYFIKEEIPVGKLNVRIDCFTSLEQALAFKQSIDACSNSTTTVFHLKDDKQIVQIE